MHTAPTPSVPSRVLANQDTLGMVLIAQVTLFKLQLNGQQKRATCVARLLLAEERCCTFYHQQIKPVI